MQIRSLLSESRSRIFVFTDLVSLLDGNINMEEEKNQDWEFVYRFSERIARFVPKNERMRANRSKKRAIYSFLVSDLSDLLTSLIFGERPERFAHIPHQKRGNERIVNFFYVYKKY